MAAVIATMKLHPDVAAVITMTRLRPAVDVAQITDVTIAAADFSL